jgi:hypothetical protein
MNLISKTRLLLAYFIITLWTIVSCSCGGNIVRRDTVSGGNGGGIIVTPSSPTWGTAHAIETDSLVVASQAPQIAIDGAGKAIAVWARMDLYLHYTIWANRFDSTAWGTAEVIETNEWGPVSANPQIAMNGAGKAIAVWQRTALNNHSNIIANYFDGTAWGLAEIIDDDSGRSNSPQIAMNSAGIAIAVWNQSNHIWTNRFNGSVWGTAEAIDSNSGWAENPQIAVDSFGKAIAVWEQPDGAYESIWANRFDGTDWGTAEMIETNNAGHAGLPRIAMNGAGNAIVAWYQFDGARYNIWANRFNGKTWGIAEPIGIGHPDYGSASYPQVSINNTDNAIVVWEEYDGARYNIWANRFYGTAWGIANLIETDNSGNARNPQVAIDNSSKAMAVWEQYDGVRYNIWANRFNGANWGIADLIEINNAGDAADPQVAIDGAGNAIAVWGQFDGIRYSIWANRYE